MKSFEKSNGERGELKFSRRSSLKFRLIQAIAIANFGFWVLAIFPFILRYFGVNFLPVPHSPTFLPAWTHWVIGVLLTLPFVLFFLLLAKHSYLEGDGKGFLFQFATAFFSPFMTGFAVNVSLGATLPMIHTAMFGTEGQIEYVVTNKYSTSTSRRQGCVRGIDVETHVFGYSSLCGFDWEAKNNLSKGSLITVSGKVSRAGIYYTSFRRGPIQRE